MTTTTLRLSFKNEENKTKSISLTNAAVNLSEKEIRDVMDEIAAADVFQKDGVDLYKIPCGAEYIERTVNVVFDDTANK